MSFKKERQELVFRIQSNIYHRPLLGKQLTARSFIVDILPGFKYPSDERNYHFSFQIKATLKSTTLAICMCCTELLFWKNQKSSNCYPITLFKWDSIADTFLEILNFFWTSYFKKQLHKPLIVKGFYLFRMSHDFCFHGIPKTWDPGPRTLRWDPRVGP